MQSIGNLILYINIYMDNNIDCSLLFLSLLLDNKKDYLDQFKNNSIVELKVNTKSALILHLSKLPFFQSFGKKSSSPSKWELTILKSTRDVFLLSFKNAKRVIEVALSFQPKFWQIVYLLNVKNGHDIVILAKTRLDKSLLFQAFSFIKKNIIALFIISTLALIKY